MNQSVLALDLGTSSCKGAIYDATGALVAEASQGYPVQRPAPSWVEQDPEHWWEAASIVCRRLLERAPAGNVAAVGLSGQVPTMVMVDAEGRALTPAISWQDRRSDREAAGLRSTPARNDSSGDWAPTCPSTRGGPPPASFGGAATSPIWSPARTES